MTDPRNDPAATPGSEGGTSPPEQSSERQPRHGLFHRGASGQQSAGSGTSGASAVGTATRGDTTSSGTAVPQQAAQTEHERTGAEQQYGRQEDRYGYGMGAAEPSAVITRATNMSFGGLLLGALCLIAVGIMLLVWPHASLTLVAILIGAGLVATGVVRLWDGMAGRQGEQGGSRAASVVIGILAILVGLYCLRHHALSLFLLSFVVGVYFIAHGIADLNVAISGRGVPGRGLRGVLGLFAIAAGIILVVWPGISLALLLTITAAWLLFYGCVLGALAFTVRRSGKKLSRDAARTTMATPARAA